MDWKIFYEGGFSFSSGDGQPEEAPIWNVQVIVMPHIESGRRVRCLFDYYVWWGDRWEGVDLTGVMDFLIERGEYSLEEEIGDVEFRKRAFATGRVKAGRTIEKEEFYSLYRAADRDPEFPKRTGYMADEWKIGDST